MNTWVQVDKLQNSEPVNSDTLNRPVDQLASRTEYLKKRLGTIMEDGVQSSLVLTDVTLIPDENDTMKVGNIVYRGEDGFRKAQAKMHLYDDFTASDAAFTIGVLISVTGNIGDVLIYGKMDLGSTSVLKENILQSGETFRPGRYYLSANEKGKMTANPNGPLIYLGSFFASEGNAGSFSGDDVAYVNPQFLDIGTSHVHRAYTLVARPAGTVIGKYVIGYLPIGATYTGLKARSPTGGSPVVNSPVEPSSSPESSLSSSESSDPDTEYPSLIFDGTWTSVPKVEYVFTLDDSSAWGSVRLKWYKNGLSSSYQYVEIPAPDVFVDLDNGLKVKVHFPEATSTRAFSGLSEAERTWILKFPDAGKGWVNHAVDAIADDVNKTSTSTTAGSEVTPEIHAILSGSWPTNKNHAYVLFPSSVNEATITSGIRRINIGGVKYQFVESGATPATGYIAVPLAATIEETLLNLADICNEDPSKAYVLVRGTKLYVAGKTLSGTGISVTSHTGVGEEGFGIVGGAIPAMLVFNGDYEALGPLVLNAPTYAQIKLDSISISVYAKGATDTNNYTCMPNTYLHAFAYDYSPKAAYDYVMGLHQEVDYYFPPVPAQAAGLFVNGVEMENAALYPDNPTYVVGKKTIHWMEDETSRLPWPDSIHHHDDPVLPSLDKTLTFYFVVGFQCATGPVTSVVPAPGSAIKLYTYGTSEEAYTGDLMIDAALDLSVVDAGVSGYKVAKQGKGGQLLAGAVVERIKAGKGLVVTQPSSCPVGQGTVTIALDNGSLRGQFNEIALENAKQEKIGLFPYVSLLGWGESNNIPSAFTTMMRVPSNMDIKDYQLQLRFVMFGATSYSGSRRRAAGVQLEYNILPDYTDKTNLSLKTGLLVPDNPRQIAVPLGHQDGTNWVYNAFDPFVATTDASMEKEADVCVPLSELPLPSTSEFSTKIPELKPGYLLAIRVSRISTPDTQSYSAYTGPLGFLSLEWTLEEA